MSAQPGDGESGPQVPEAGQSMQIPGPPRPPHREEEQDPGPVFQKPAGPTLRGSRDAAQTHSPATCSRPPGAPALASPSATGLQTWVVTLGDRGGTPGPKRETQRAPRRLQTGRRRVHAAEHMVSEAPRGKRTEGRRTVRASEGPLGSCPAATPVSLLGTNGGSQAASTGTPGSGSCFHPFPGGMEDRVPVGCWCLMPPSAGPLTTERGDVSLCGDKEPLLPEEDFTRPRGRESQVSTESGDLGP